MKRLMKNKQDPSTAFIGGVIYLSFTDIINSTILKQWQDASTLSAKPFYCLIQQFRINL